MKYIFALTSALAFSSVALANPLSYDFIQIGFVENQLAGFEVFEQTGPEFQGSMTIFDNIFMQGRYRELDDSIAGDNGFNHNLDETNWQFGVGYVFTYSQATTFDVSVNVGRFGIDIDTGTELQRGDSNHHSFATNVRHMMTENIELSGGLEWQFWEGSLEQKAYRLKALYHFKDFSFGAGYTKYSDLESCSIFARYSF